MDPFLKFAFVECGDVYDARRPTRAQWVGSICSDERRGTLGSPDIVKFNNFQGTNKLFRAFFLL